MTSEQIATDRAAFLALLMAAKKSLERCLAAVDAAILMYGITFADVEPASPPRAKPSVETMRPIVVPPIVVSKPSPMLADPPFAPPTVMPAEVQEPALKPSPDRGLFCTTVAGPEAPAAGPMMGASNKTYTPARNRVICKEWKKGTPLAEITAQVNLIPGERVDMAGVSRQARRMELAPREPAVEHRLPSRLSRSEILRQVGDLKGRVPQPVKPEVPPAIEFDPGPAIAMEFEQVRRWAGERGIEFKTWEDLPAVNERREHLKQASFKRDFSRRPG